MSSRNKKNRSLTTPAVTAPPSFSFLLKLLIWGSLGWAGWCIYAYAIHYPWMFDFPPAPVLTVAATQWSVFWADAKSLFLLITLTAGITALGSYLLRLFNLPWRSSLE